MTTLLFWHSLADSTQLRHISDDSDLCWLEWVIHILVIIQYSIGVLQMPTSILILFTWYFFLWCPQLSFTVCMVVNSLVKSSKNNPWHSIENFGKTSKSHFCTSQIKNGNYLFILFYLFFRTRLSKLILQIHTALFPTGFCETRWSQARFSNHYAWWINIFLYGSVTQLCLR